MLADYADYTKLVLSNFGLFMFALAVFFILLHRMIVGNRLSEYEIVYRWMALFPLGLTGIYCFVIHAYYPELADATIGWPASPFEYEVAIANLGFGVIAVLSFNTTFGFRLAAVIGNVIWLMGNAVQHINLMLSQGNYNIGNAGSWLWMQDLILPLIMLICIIGLSKRR